MLAVGLMDEEGTIGEDGRTVTARLENLTVSIPKDPGNYIRIGHDYNMNMMKNKSRVLLFMIYQIMH